MTLRSGDRSNNFQRKTHVQQAQHFCHYYECTIITGRLCHQILPSCQVCGGRFNKLFLISCSTEILVIHSFYSDQNLCWTWIYLKTCWICHLRPLMSWNGITFAHCQAHPNGCAQCLALPNIMGRCLIIPEYRNVSVFDSPTAELASQKLLTFWNGPWP